MDIELFVRKLQEAVGGRPEIDRSRTEQIVGAVFSALSAGLASSEAEAEATARCVIHFLLEAVGSGDIQGAPGPMPSQSREWIPAA